jgi:type I restriction enzyme S subunit
MTTLRPYPAYKPSCVDWLGDIPSHWHPYRLKHLFREVDERSTSGKEEQLSVSHITGVTARSDKKVTMFQAESYEDHKLCRPDDLVVNTMWAWMGALGVSGLYGLVSPS